MYDVIVVGARCAGSPTAILLARKGYRVLLLDKATFPSDTLSTHYIHQPGIARLKRWGLLDQLIASNCPPISRATIDFGPFALSGSPPPTDGIAAAYCPRRTVLDKLLVDAAVEAGADLCEGFAVREILMNGERVTGIYGHAPGGVPIMEQASIVIGADGMRSFVARTAQSPMYHTKPSLTCTYYSYWSGISIEGVEMYLRDHRVIIVFPTNDDLVCIVIQWPQREFHTFRTDIEGNFLKTVDLVPELAERVRYGRREERLVGTADLPNFFRKPYGPGWALVGDAGYHKDPHLGQGITDAFRDAELLAEGVDVGLSGRRPLKEALADYERRRNEAVMPMYELNSQLASLEPPPPQMQQLFSALCGNQAETDRFLGTIAGTIPIPEFFSPQNMERIVTGRNPVALLAEQIDGEGDARSSLPHAA
jgi:2-polyprenyl-6-methoxyphenol hydroxylase-like FAD-dependent oxidoreductase